jgi:protease Do-like 1, chloroplastic
MNRTHKWIWSSLLVVGLIDATPAAAQNVSSRLLEDERNTIDIFEQASNAVVFITNKAYRRVRYSRNVLEVPLGSGSGFVWDGDGHIVTNNHVVEGGDRFVVTLSDGKSYDAQLVGTDPFKDLAVLRLEEPVSSLRPIQRSDSTQLLVGQKVIAIGNPFGLDQTLTTGVISALGREIKSQSGATITDVIQTDASINPGNSGGPLLDSSGGLIGVNTMIYSTSGSSAGIGFAVPASTVLRVVPQLIRFGQVKRVGLGISVVRDEMARRWGIDGAIVEGVVEGGSADRAGIKPLDVSRGHIVLGDVIVEVEGRAIRTFDDLYLAFDSHDEGDVVDLQVERDGKRRVVKAKLQRVN